MTQEKRLVYNDIAKSLGMLLIIWGHIRLYDWSNAFVYAFHIPLFFMLSGMVFSKKHYRCFSDFLKRKIKSLIIPYIIFSFITWIIWAFFSYFTHQSVSNYWMPLAETFIAQGSGGYLIHNVPLWFVSCLFVMEIIYYFIANMKDYWIILCTFLMVLISYFAITNCKIIDFKAIPWNIETAFLGMPFYAVGHMIIRKYGHQTLIKKVNENKLLSWILVVFLAAIVFIGSMWNGSISFGHDDLGKNAFVAYVNAFSGVIMLITLSILIGEWKTQYFSKVINWIAFFGRNSFNAMVIHNPIKGIICVIVGVFLHCGSNNVSKNSTYSFIAFLATLIVTILCIHVINWTKLRFGKRK